MAVRHKKIAVVTGGSSGIGRCTAAALRDKGYLVYEFSRRHIPISGVNHLSVDVTDEEMVTSAIHHIMKAEGKIDAVVNCAGFGISGTPPTLLQRVYFYSPPLPLPRYYYVHRDIPVLDVFLVQSHHFFEVCDIASATDLPQSGDARFDGQSCIMMQFIQVGF